MFNRRSPTVWMTLLLLTAGALSNCARRESPVTERRPPAETTVVARPPSAQPSARAKEKVPLAVQGEVIAVSKVPEPGSAPYTECLTFIKYKVLSVERGDYPRPEILTVHWGMKDNKLAPAARYKVGDRHRLELEPFSGRPELARLMQADDTNEYELSPYWVR